MIDNASHRRETKAARGGSDDRLLMVFGSRTALSQVLPSLSRHRERLVLVEDECELAKLVEVDKSEVRAMLEEISVRRPRAVECAGRRSEPRASMREPLYLLVFVAAAVVLAAIGSPIMLSLAFIFGIAAYSSLMGIARQMARSSSAPIWAKAVNYIRECLANEPEISESL
jgi:hypothetical protein